MLKRINKYITPVEDEEDESQVEEKSIESEKEEMPLLNNKRKREEKEEEEMESVFVEYCILCNKTLTNKTSYENHLNSKKHKKNFKSQIVSEIKEAGSIKEFLIKKGFINRLRTSLNKTRYYLYFNSLRKMFD